MFACVKNKAAFNIFRHTQESNLSFKLNEPMLYLVPPQFEASSNSSRYHCTLHPIAKGVKY